MCYAVSRNVSATYTQRSHYVATYTFRFRDVNTLCIPGNVSLPKSFANYKQILARVTYFHVGNSTFPNCLLGSEPYQSYNILERIWRRA